ncbi:MAG TPA: hypothetical protein VNZ48_18630 [Xanthobacteraceae bacterium]|nr:hypothetical protein [Xanthobacteraceae bacterium]
MQAERNHAGKSTLRENLPREPADARPPIGADAGHRGGERPRQTIRFKILPLLFGIQEKARIGGRRGIKFMPSAAWMVEDPLQNRSAVFLGGGQEMARRQPRMIQRGIKAQDRGRTIVEAELQFGSQAVLTERNRPAQHAAAFQILHDVLGVSAIVFVADRIDVDFGRLRFIANDLAKPVQHDDFVDV